MNVSFLRASLAGDREGAASAIGMELPEVWPTKALESVLAIRLEQLERAPADAPWLTRTVELCREKRMVGVCGFHGPPGLEYLRDFAPEGQSSATRPSKASAGMASRRRPAAAC